MRYAFQQLRKPVFERKIRISRADQGSAVGLQNVDDYFRVADLQLNNPKH